MNSNAPIDASKQFVSPQELARVLGLSKRTIERLAAAGVFKRYKFGRAVRFRLVECEASIAEAADQ